MRYGLEYTDIRAFAAVQKEKKPVEPMKPKQMEKMSMEEPSTAALKCLQLSASKPNNFFVPDFNRYLHLVNKWILENATLLGQLQSYYHELCLKSEKIEKCQRNKRVKDITAPNGYQVIYNSQTGNSLYCAISILLIGSMKLERTLRSLATCFYCQMHKFLPDIKTDFDLSNSDQFKNIFVRGYDGNLGAAFCLCCSLGSQLTVIRQLSDGKFDRLILSASAFNQLDSVPSLGTILLSCENQFWPIVPTSKAEILNDTQLQFASECNIDQILGHNWCTAKYTDWDEFNNVKCYVKRDIKKPKTTTKSTQSDKQETAKDSKQKSQAKPQGNHISDT